MRMQLATYAVIKMFRGHFIGVGMQIMQYTKYLSFVYKSMFQMDLYTFIVDTLTKQGLTCVIPVAYKLRATGES